jgi:hypothetical protein
MSIDFTGVGSITLPNPVLGDSLWFDGRAIIRKTRGLDLLAIYGDWAQLERFSLTWRWLSSDAIDDLATFLQSNLGLTFEYEDYRGVSNNVISLTPEASFIHEGRDGCSDAGGQHNVSLELEVI